MDFLKSIYQESKIVQLREWISKWDNLSQKPSQSTESYLTEYNTLVSTAKTKFGHEIHPQFKAMKLLSGQTVIPAEHVAALTANLEITAQDFDKQTEQIIRNYASNTKALAPKTASNRTFLQEESSDCLGNPMGSNSTYKTVGSKTRPNQVQREQRRQELMSKGLCLKCESPGHFAKNCPKQKTDQENYEARKQQVLSQGKPWINRDGSVLWPNGQVTRQPSTSPQTS